MKKLNALILLALISTTAHSETLLIENVDKSARAFQPVRGESMAQVESKYGTAIEKKAAVGEPPITRWVYSKFTVYFEDNRVIHSVANH